ncbi:MAG: serine/threonine-protein kinase, partial [Planctomycetaceae bacterium]
MTDSHQPPSEHTVSPNERRATDDGEQPLPDSVRPVDEHPRQDQDDETVAVTTPLSPVSSDRVPIEEPHLEHTSLDQPSEQHVLRDKNDAERTMLDQSHANHTQPDADAERTRIDTPDAERTMLDQADVEHTILDDNGISDHATTMADHLTTPANDDQRHSNVEPQLTHFRMVEKVAQGGMGRIWRAEDDDLRRQVAYKEMLPEVLNRPDLVERFVEEAQITGQLEHPGIVPVYELGRTSDGAPYYAMKLVHGISLDDAIKAYHALPADSGELKLGFVKLLRQFVAVCNAMGFAHMRGVLHRDLKPENIMLGDFGEALVLDWGLAKVTQTHLEGSAGTESTFPIGATGRSDAATVATDTTAEVLTADAATIAHEQPASFSQSVSTSARSSGTETMVGSIIGTPYYMSPEQAQG